MKWIGLLICVAVGLQSMESLATYSWPWRILKPEIPKLFFWIRNHKLLHLLRLLLAAIAIYLPNPYVVFGLWLLTWGINVRWRGTFNGASDIFTFHILLAWLVSLIWPQWTAAATLYIAVQLILSYFVAGLSKIQNIDWRNGRALSFFLRQAGRDISHWSSLIGSWLIIGFELLFPLSVFAPMPFVVAGAIFHLCVTYVFGLNRFFFVWLAAYPALFQ